MATYDPQDPYRKLQVLQSYRPTSVSISTARTQPLAVQGTNIRVAQDPNARTGVAAPAAHLTPSAGLLYGYLGGLDALHGAANIGPQLVGQIKAITPRPLDQYADWVRKGTQKIVDAPFSLTDQAKAASGLYDVQGRPISKGGAIAQTAGNIAGNALLIGPAAVDTARAIPGIVRATPNVARNILQLPSNTKNLVTSVKDVRQVAKAGGDATSVIAGHLAQQSHPGAVHSVLDTVLSGLNPGVIAAAAAVIAKETNPKLVEQTLRALSSEANKARELKLGTEAIGAEAGASGLNTDVRDFNTSTVDPRTKPVGKNVPLDEAIADVGAKPSSLPKPVDAPKVTAPDPTVVRTNPKTGAQTTLTQNDLIDELATLHQIPKAERTVAQNTQMQEAEKGLRLIKKQQDDLQKTVEQATPTAPIETPTARAEAIQQATQGTDASTAVSAAPAAEGAPSVAADIAQAQLTPDQLAAEAINAAEASKARYGKYSKVQKAKDAYDPRNRAIKIDRAYAKAQGVHRREIGADESLDALIERSTQSKQEAAAMIRGSDIEKIIKTVGKKDKDVADFNLYRLFKRDIEQRADGRPTLNVDSQGNPFTVEDMQRFVDEYERANPGADDAVRALSAEIKQAQDWAAEHGVVPSEDISLARMKKDGTEYQYYTPATRAMPEERIGPNIASQNVGTLGRQKVLQDFTGSMLPVDPSFKSITDYIETVVRQVNQVKVAQKYAERTAQGFTGARVIQTGDETARLAQLKATQKELQDTANSVKKEIIRTNAGARVAARRVDTAKAQLKTADTAQSLKLKAAQKEAGQRVDAAVKQAKEVLKKGFTADDADASAAIDSLNNDDLLDILNYATQDELFSKGATGKGVLKMAQSATQKAAGAEARTKAQDAALRRIASKSEAHAALVQKATDMRLDLESLKTAKNGVREQIVELTPDPYTGQQTILGRDTKGNPFRIEVPPEDANLLQGYNSENINDVLKLVGAAQKPFREAFTGILNLPFQVAQATFNTFMLPITSREGIKVFGPRSIAAAFKSINSNSEFQKGLRAHGAITYSGGFNQLPRDEVGKAIASQATTLGKVKWFANPKRAWHIISGLGGQLDKAARSGAASAVYRASLKAGRTTEQALDDARYEYNNALPNFANASSFLKGLDNAVMYTNPSVAGTRTLFRVIRDNPVKTTAKVAAGALGLTGVAAYSLAQDQGQAFYEDMHRAGKDYILDNNVVMVLPGAHKDKKTGEWSGVIKIPLAPEMRPINRAIRLGFDPSNHGQDPKTYARAMFDFLTGQIATSSNPVINTGAGLATGKDPRSGYDIYDQSMTPEEKRKAQEKYIIGGFGTVGRQIAGESDKSVGDTLKDKVYGAKGLTEGGEYYKTEGEAIKSVGLNENERKAYESIVAPRGKDLAGNTIKEKTYYDAAARADIYLKMPKTLEVSKRVDAANRAAGKPGDPFFDLKPDQQKVVLNIQREISPGNKEGKAIAKLNPWITDFYKQRSAYFDQVKSTMSKEDQKKMGIDPKGITVPVAAKDIQDRMDYASTLTDAKAKSAVYREPEVADFLAQQNAYQRTKRAFLGLPQFDQYPTPDADTQKIMDAYSKLPKGNGPLKKDGTPSSPDRSAWIKAHPNEWAKMGAAFDKIGAWTANDEGALAVYEGIDNEEPSSGSSTGTGNSFSYNGFNYEHTGTRVKITNPDGSVSYIETDPTKMKTHAAELLGPLNLDQHKAPKLNFGQRKNPKLRVTVPTTAKVKRIVLKS